MKIIADIPDNILNIINDNNGEIISREHLTILIKSIIDGAAYIGRTQGEAVIKCKNCKYQVKEWREDERMKNQGYWVYGCEHFGEIMGYWGFGGNDNEFCSDAERKGGADRVEE